MNKHAFYFKNNLRSLNEQKMIQLCDDLIFDLHKKIIRLKFKVIDYQKYKILLFQKKKHFASRQSCQIQRHSKQ